MALCLALSFSNYSNSQDISTTGNLVSQTSWDGCATYLRTRIWGGYSGGPCPNVGNDGTGINFSYGQTTLSQTIAINRALQDTGVQVNGYNYSWQVKNSNINGQQPGQFDPIASINVQIKDTKGTTVVNDVYNYGYHLPNWTTFSGTQTFANPYVANTLSSIGLSVTSKDSGYWAGYYGPEFMNFRLSLNYSAAPPPPPPPPVPKTTTPTYTASASATPTSVDTSSVPSSTVSVGGVQLSATGEIAAPDNIPQVLKDSVATVSAAASASVASTTPATDAVAKPESNKSGPSAAVMNAVKQIQAADKAVQARAVQNANQQIAASSSRAQEQAMAIVDTATAMSASTSQSNSQATAQSSTVSIMQAPQQAASQSSQSSSQASVQVAMVAPQVTQPLMQQSTMQTTQSAVQTSSQMSMPAPVVIQQYIPFATQSQIQVEVINAPPAPAGLPMLMSKAPMIYSAANQDTSIQNEFSLNAQPTAVNRGTVLNEPIDFKLFLETNVSEVRADSVNRNVQINDLAGGVDITAMATQPKGYEVYSMLTVKDAGFYAPKDIYGNQTNVDNARALRQLGSDRLHREMVDQQFRR